MLDMKLEYLQKSYDKGFSMSNYRSINDLIIDGYCSRQSRLGFAVTENYTLFSMLLTTNVIFLLTKHIWFRPFTTPDPCCLHYGTHTQETVSVWLSASHYGGIIY